MTTPWQLQSVLINVVSRLAFGHGLGMDARSGETFHCRRCDYEVHADVNAAINIATRE